jgi:hypothetical protein
MLNTRYDQRLDSPDEATRLPNVSVNHILFHVKRICNP